MRAASIRDAVRDVVTTVTADKTNATILTDDLVNRVCTNAVGGDCPGKPSCNPASCAAPRCLWSTNRRPGWRANCSRWSLALPCMTSGGAG